MKLYAVQRGGNWWSWDCRLWVSSVGPGCLMEDRTTADTEVTRWPGATVREYVLVLAGSRAARLIAVIAATEQAIDQADAGKAPLTEAIWTARAQVADGYVLANDWLDALEDMVHAARAKD